MADAFIGLGSNLGEREKNIGKAVELLAAHPKIRIEKVSSLYESAPLEMESKNPFLNAVARLTALLTPQKLALFLTETEEVMGREKESKGRRTDRVIDLDLLFYNDLIFSVNNLCLPHPALHKRKFVLVPMLEIAPDFEHPLLGAPLSNMLSGLGESQRIELWKSPTT